MKKIYFVLVFLMCPNLVLAGSVEPHMVLDLQDVKGGRYIKRTLDDLKIDGKEKKIAGREKIALPFFRTNFLTSDKYTNRVGGMTTSTSKVKSSLEGIDPQTMQSITNEMYVNLRQQLENQGFEVLSYNDYKDHEKFAAMEVKYPDSDRDEAKFTAMDMPYPGTFKNPSGDMAKDLDAVIVQADLDINYIVINRNTKKFTLGDKAAVKISQGVSVTGIVTLFTDKHQVTITIQQPVQSMQPFGVALNETSAMNVTSDAIVAVGSIIGGNGLGSNRQKTRTITVQGRPDAYREAARDALMQTNELIAEAMKSLSQPDAKENTDS